MGCRILIQDDPAPRLTDNDSIANDDCTECLIAKVNRGLTHLECALHECRIAGIGRLMDCFIILSGRMPENGAARPNRQSAETGRRQKPPPCEIRSGPAGQFHFSERFHSIRIMGLVSP